MHRSLRLMLAAGIASLALGAAAEAATLTALTNDNTLVRIDSTTRRAGAPMRITGADGALLGIDVRPADGKLYGVTVYGQIVTIDDRGHATQVSRLNMPFTPGGRAVVDFNPVANRLRLMGPSGMNFRVNVDTGEVTRDGDLKYAAGTPGSPSISAGAYTNSMMGATATMLFTVDTMTRMLNLQAPPNDGVQQAKGEIAPSLPAGVAFDILSDGQGGNTAFLLAAGTLHTLSLENGRATTVGPITGLPRNVEILDIAATR
jgi:hypothetical protein